MKNWIGVLVVLVSLPLAMLSCDPASQYKSEIYSIDSCLTKIDSIESLFDGIEFDSISLMVEDVLEKDAEIKQWYHPDTINEDIARKLSAVKNIRKALSTVPASKGVIGDELNAVKHQFMDLKSDILEGLYNDDQITEYLNIEKLALEKVTLTFNSFYIMQKQEKERYYRVIPSVGDFIADLKKTSETPE